MAHWIENIKDPKMKKVIDLALNVAPRKATILITGESGVGKELMARLIHERSQRSQHSFTALNCAAVPENLLESELFGFDKGAFTGAHQSKLGKFEVADKGTLLLDEISELPLQLQGKLLRVLQEGELERLGSNQIKKIDVRVICTSNRDLAEMVRKGQFRQDLFYRLNVIPLLIPSLRDRQLDLPNLVHDFLKRVSDENQMTLKSLTPSAMDKILAWRWPGNVRELQNVIERSCLMSSRDQLQESDILIEGADRAIESNQVASVQLSPGMTLQEAERRLILKTLELTKANRTQAARMLGISIRTLRNKLHEYKLDATLENQGEIG